VLKDDTLLHLARYLEHVAQAFNQRVLNDVRPSIRRFQSGHEKDEPDFLQNFTKYANKEEQNRLRKRKQGLGAQLRKTNILQAKSAANVTTPTPTSAPPTLIQTNQYRKTVWERMMDPETVAKQDRELQTKEANWQAYAKKLT
jgi:hypothetical protein